MALLIAALKCAHVATYTFYVHTDGEAVPSFRIVECADDQAALRAAVSELSLSRRASRIEVVSDEREIATVDRSHPFIEEASSVSTPSEA